MRLLATAYNRETAQLAVLAVIGGLGAMKPAGMTPPDLFSALWLVAFILAISANAAIWGYGAGKRL